MKKIIFVNPPLSIEDRYGVKSSSGGQTPPLGLLNLAAMTREHGFETAILDAAAVKWGYEQSVKFILDNRFQYVGITAVTISIAHAAKLASLLKRADPKIIIIIGGAHLTALPSETMSMFPHFDIGVVGEADYTIVELLSALESKRDLTAIKGLILRDNNRLVNTGIRPRIENLDSLPMPAWDLLPDLAQYYCPPVHTLKRIPAAT